ncbi:MAG: hypothetical protein ACJA1Z_000416 [Patiriisocius sp.]|jgi:hypothetical protein
MKKYKIAIITAFIGNGGKTGELGITDEAQTQFDEYGVDLYRFNNENIDLLKPFYESQCSKEDIINLNIWDKISNIYTGFKYKQDIKPSDQDNYTRLIAKIPKVLFFKLIPQEYDYYVWLDSKFTIEENWLKYLLWLLSKYYKYDIISSKHSERDSIRQEYQYMFDYISIKDKDICLKYSGQKLAIQYQLFRKKKNYLDNRLFELTMIIYSKSILKQKEFLEEWYAHNQYLSIQDQLSFPLLVKKYKLKVGALNQRVFDMPFTTHEYGRI